MSPRWLKRKKNTKGHLACENPEPLGISITECLQGKRPLYINTHNSFTDIIQV